MKTEKKLFLNTTKSIEKMEIIEQKWASRLGLAINPLFGLSDQPSSGHHLAMVDGVAGSFALSKDYDSAQRDVELSSWAWSSLLRHHVTLNADNVEIRSANSRVSPETFTRQSIERNLDGFLKFLESRAEVPRMDVAEHIISAFRKHCQWIGSYNEPNSPMFLALIAVGLEHGLQAIPDAADLISNLKSKYRLTDSSVSSVSIVNKDYLRRFADELGFCTLEGRPLNLDLAIRHANGPIFQDAHALLDNVPNPQGTLFGLGNDIPKIASYGRGAYFTPQGLARSIADYVLPRLLTSPKTEIVIADFACGSGVFLAEAIRTLVRSGFSGRVKLMGVDISPDAIAMAEFNTACAIRDVGNRLTVETDFRSGDFFRIQVDWSNIDACLMNPPFISWEAMTKEQQNTVRKTLGSNYKGRMDYSSAFLTHIVENLKPTAWVASLLPVGVISGKHGEKWRNYITELAQPVMLGTLGDHGLFRGALVNPAIAILQKQPSNDGQVILLWSSERRDAASAGLRELRKASNESILTPARTGDWALYPVAKNEFKLRTSWLPTPAAIGALLPELRATTPTTVSDLFAIKQGVRAGLRDAFIINQDRWESLPKNEQVHFKPVADSRHILGGQIISDSYILWPVGEYTGSEAEVKKLVPTFYETVFSQYIDRLSKRKGVSPDTPGKQTRERTWLKTNTPRIVSKMFARSFGFAPDLNGKYVIVQGLAWQPRARVIQAFGSDIQSLQDALLLYTALLNSEVFFRLIQDFTTNVAGGQFDLSAKFLNNVPLPDLGSRLGESPELNDQARRILTMSPSDNNYEYVTLANEFAALSYRTSLNQWLSDKTK